MIYYYTLENAFPPQWVVVYMRRSGLHVIDGAIATPHGLYGCACGHW